MKLRLPPKKNDSEITRWLTVVGKLIGTRLGESGSHHPINNRTTSTDNTFRALEAEKIKRRRLRMLLPSSENTLVPMSRSQAADLVNKLLGSYPHLKLHDPEIYMTGLVALLSRYPLWAGVNVVGKLTSTTKWPPAHGEVAPLLEEEVAYEKRAEERRLRESQYLNHVDPAPRLEGPKAPKLSYDELKAKYGPTWGIGTAQPLPPKMFADKTLADLEMEFGRDVLAAVPNHQRCPKCKRLEFASCIDRECPMPASASKMSVAVGLGRIADRLMDDFDREFGM